jgi:hypothetical protein
MTAKKDFLNFEDDHMTLLLQPELYNVTYVLFRTVFGIGPDDLLYEKRKEWVKGQGEESMTFAARVGSGVKDAALNNTIFAVVQPTEPKSQRSHVRDMLDGHQAAAHFQHIALRTTDLLAFHKHAEDRGVNFITPVLKDDSEDLIQVFSGEFYFPGIKSSGMFFEFLQRNPTADALQKLANRNRESWFRDETFLGLYGEKEREYQSGKVTPFIDFELFNELREVIGSRKLWEIDDAVLKKAEERMLAYGAKRAK